MTKILVVGVAGFIGSHTVEAWKGKRDKIWGIDDFSSGSRENLLGCLQRIMQIYEHDIADREAVFRTFNLVKPDVVLHLAAQPSLLTSFEKPSLDIKTNVFGTMQILEAAKHFEVKHFVFASTSAVSETEIHSSDMDMPLEYLPKSPYGISKLAAEMYIRSMLPESHTILRYANIYGPRQVPLGENQLIPRAIRHVLYGDDFEIYGDGEQSRDFTYVRDVAKANYLACTKRIPGTFYVSTNWQSSVNQILGCIKQSLGYEGEWKRGAPRQDRDSCVLPNEKINTFYKWRPEIMIGHGIQQTVDWWKKQERDNG